MDFVQEKNNSCDFFLRNDDKLVLTCMGALNDDSSVVLWSSEKHDVSCLLFFILSLDTSFCSIII